MPKSPNSCRVVSSRLLGRGNRLEDLPPPVGTEVAFIGRSNVGKSTLLNSLLGRPGLARTSSTPGCTRAITMFEATLADGLVLHLVDLPGYGYAARSKAERSAWALTVEQYLLERPTLAAGVVLVDVRRGLESDDRDALQLLDSPPRVPRRPLGSVVVATKLDKLSLSERKPAMALVGRGAGRPVVPFSMRLTETVPELWLTLRRVLGLLDAHQPGEA